MDHRPKEDSVDWTMTINSVTTVSITDEVLSKVEANHKSLILFFTRKETKQTSLVKHEQSFSTLEKNLEEIEE